jgi:hypothetical protein
MYAPTNLWNTWNSLNYNLTDDLDVCMNPYGKDAYGNYRIGTNNNKYKMMNNNPDKLVYPAPKYKVDDINMWCLENGTIVVGRIVRVYPASEVVSGEHVNRYAINMLTDGIYSNNEIYVTENMAIEGLDNDTYDTACKIGELPGYYPLDTNSDKPYNTDFKCDIDDLKTDINDLRTDIKSLLENQYKIEGDLRVAKQPELGISIDDTVTSDIRDIKESGARLDCTVNYCVDNIDTIKTQLDEVDNKVKRTSRLSKLALLSGLL